MSNTTSESLPGLAGLGLRRLHHHPLSCAVMPDSPAPGEPRDDWKRTRLMDEYDDAPTSAAALCPSRSLVRARQFAAIGAPTVFLVEEAAKLLQREVPFDAEIDAADTAAGVRHVLGLVGDAPIVYARRNSLMTPAHAGLLNGGICLEKKRPLVVWDDCARWSESSSPAERASGRKRGSGGTSASRL